MLPCKVTTQISSSLCPKRGHSSRATTATIKTKYSTCPEVFTCGTYNTCMYALFCALANFSLPTAGLFSRSRLRGTQGGRVHTAMQAWAPAGLRGACSGHSKSRELALFHGIAFRDAEPPRTMETPKFQLDSLCGRCITPPLQLSSSLLCGGHGTTTVAHQAFPFVAVTDGASGCPCVP